MRRTAGLAPLRRAALATLALAALALPIQASGSVRAFPGANGSIVFASQRAGGGWELYVGARGGAPRRLTAQSPEEFGAPVWSPDGHTIAFQRESDLGV